MSATTKLCKKLDTEFSRRIRERDRRLAGGMCVFGCGRLIEQCFHFITRAKWAVRWDPRNAVGSCGGCNLENEHNAAKFITWYIRRHGLDAWETLFRESNKIFKAGIGEMELMLERLQVEDCLS